MALKILLADDSLTAQNMGKKILTDAGYEVIAVSNGAQAMKRIASDQPALVVLDVYMPGYSGVEVCEHLRNTRETAGTPVLLSVGKMEPFRREEADRAGADAIIIKPFEASELVATVRQLAAKVKASKPAQAEPAPEPEIEQSGSASTSTPFGEYKGVLHQRSGSAELESESEAEKLEVPQEMASAPAAGMEWIAEEPSEEATATVEEPPSAPAEFELEPEQREAGDASAVLPSMVSASGFSGVFEMQASPVPAAEPVVVRPFEVDSFSPPGEPEVAAEVMHVATTEAEPLVESPPVSASAESGSAADSAMAQAVAEFMPSAAASAAITAGDHVLGAPLEQEFSVSISEPAGEEPERPVVTPAIWVAEETAVESGEASVLLQQEMARTFAPPELEETPSEISAAPRLVSAGGEEPAAAAEPHQNHHEPPSVESVQHSAVPQPAPEFSPFESLMQVAPAPEPVPEFVPASPEDLASIFALPPEATTPEMPQLDSALTFTPAPLTAQPTEFAGRAPELPVSEPAMTEPDMEAAVNSAMQQAEPEITAAMMTEVPVDPARITEIVNRVLERLKPLLVAEIARELEKDRIQ